MYRDRYVPLPDYLTREVDDVARPDIVDTYGLGAALKQCRVRIQEANGQLRELGELE